MDKSQTGDSDGGDGSRQGSFDCIVEDTRGARSVATARIDFSRVNQAPVATDDGFAGYEDLPLVIARDQLLSNDTDADNAPAALRVAAVYGAVHGRRRPRSWWRCAPR